MEKCLFSSNSDQWATPKYIFDELNKEFDFTLDPCADAKNHKCEKFFTKNENGLIQDWGGGCECFANRLTEEKYINGLKRAIGKDIKRIRSLFYWFRQGQIRNGFKILYITDRKLDF